MFKSLQSLIASIFTIDDLYLNKNSRIINHFDIAKGIRDMKGRVIIKQLTLLNHQVEFVILREENGYTVIDQTIHNNTITFYIVIPYNIGYDNFDKNERKNIIYNIYKYIINYLYDLIKPIPNTSMEKILNVAPEILTISTLYPFTYHIEEFVNDEKGITEEVIQKCIEETTEDLLDNEFIISILEGR